MAEERFQEAVSVFCPAVLELAEDCVGCFEVKGEFVQVRVGKEL